MRIPKYKQWIKYQWWYFQICMKMIFINETRKLFHTFIRFVSIGQFIKNKSTWVFMVLKLYMDCTAINYFCSTNKLDTPMRTGLRENNVTISNDRQTRVLAHFPRRIFYNFKCCLKYVISFSNIYKSLCSHRNIQRTDWTYTIN